MKLNLTVKVQIGKLKGVITYARTRVIEKEKKENCGLIIDGKLRLLKISFLFKIKKMKIYQK